MYSKKYDERDEYFSPFSKMDNCPYFIMQIGLALCLLQLHSTALFTAKITFYILRYFHTLEYRVLPVLLCNGLPKWKQVLGFR
jgi:hypothetical protein